MPSFDVRTRTSADLRQVDVVDFFERELPALIAERSELTFAGAAEYGFKPFTIATDSGTWTLALADRSFTVAPDDSGVARVRLSDESFSDFVCDLTTLEMLLDIKRLDVERGDRDDVAGWAAVLRSLLDKRPFFTAGSIVLRDRDGQPLDLTRKFTPEDDDADIAHFIAEAGFAHLSGWFDQDLIRELNEDMDREFAAAKEAGGTWWVTMENGERRPTRIPHFDKRSEAGRRLIESEAYQRLGKLTNEDFEHAIDFEAMVRPIGVVSGSSHIAWHQDCQVGMHSYKCRNIVVGISVTPSPVGSARLGVVPGSHRAMAPMNRVYPHTGLEPVFLVTEAGDATIHCSCTMHSSIQPTDFERRVIYTGFTLRTDEATEAALKRVQEQRDEIGELMSKETVEAS